MTGSSVEPGISRRNLQIPGPRAKRVYPE